MNKLKTIIVGVDFSECSRSALEQAARMAEWNQANLRIIHAVEHLTISEAAETLRLNEDVIEAIALGHDVGHTPFGHAGEEILNEICSGGFRHSAQSLRVVDVLERDGEGLNLTFEVRDGIAHHSKGKRGAPVGNAGQQPHGQVQGQDRGPARGFRGVR